MNFFYAFEAFCHSRLETFQITAPKETFRKTWSAKYTLRSHFDGVRALGFHPSEPVLITASEDQVINNTDYPR